MYLHYNGSHAQEVEDVASLVHFHGAVHICTSPKLCLNHGSDKKVCSLTLTSRILKFCYAMLARGYNSRLLSDHFIYNWILHSTMDLVVNFSVQMAMLHGAGSGIGVQMVKLPTESQRTLSMNTFSTGNLEIRR